MAMLHEMGINVIESEETEEARPRAPRPPRPRSEDERGAAGNVDDDDSAAPTIPVRMYLREMG